MLHALIRKPFSYFCCAVIAGLTCYLKAALPVEAGTSENESEENATRSYAVDAQTVHPNGVILHVSQVTVTRVYTTVQASVVNGSNTPVALNHWYRTDPTILRDAQGNAYRLTPPQGDEELQVPPGQNLEGTFVFLGHIPSTSKPLTLVINPVGSVTDRETAFPQLKAELSLTMPSDSADQTDKKKE